MQYSTIYSTNNTKHKTHICTLVLSLVLSVSRRCSVGWRVHHGRRHCVRGTIDGAAMVMSADEDVARRRRSAHDQRRMQGARGQRGHLRQRCSCRSRRQHEGVDPGAEVSHVRPRSKVVGRRQLLLAVLCKCIKPLTLRRRPPGRSRRAPAAPARCTVQVH